MSSITLKLFVWEDDKNRITFMPKDDTVETIIYPKDPNSKNIEPYLFKDYGIFFQRVLPSHKDGDEKILQNSGLLNHLQEIPHILNSLQSREIVVNHDDGVMFISAPAFERARSNSAFRTF